MEYSDSDRPVFKPLLSSRSCIFRCLSPQAQENSEASTAKSRPDRTAHNSSDVKDPQARQAVSGHIDKAELSNNGLTVPDEGCHTILAVRGSDKPADTELHSPEEVSHPASDVHPSPEKLDGSPCPTEIVHSANKQTCSSSDQKRSSLDQIRGSLDQSRAARISSINPGHSPATAAVPQALQHSSEASPEVATEPQRQEPTATIVASRRDPVARKNSEPRRLAKQLLGIDLEATDKKQQEIIKGTKRAEQAAGKDLIEGNNLAMTGEEEIDYMTQLAKIKLRSPSNEVIRAGTLWQESPTLLLLLRRPGCIMCRTESLKLEQVADRLDALNIRRVAIVFEWLELEVEDYLKGFWSGEIYLDPGREFYKALSGGKVKTGSVVGVTVNPMSRYWKNFTAAKIIMKDQPYSWKGELSTLGGCMILRPGLGGVQYIFKEEVFGDPLRVKLILDQCTIAAAYKSRSQSLETTESQPQKTLPSSSLEKHAEASQLRKTIAALAKPSVADSEAAEPGATEQQQSLIAAGQSRAGSPDAAVQRRQSLFVASSLPQSEGKRVLRNGASSSSLDSSVAAGLFLAHAQPPTFLPSAAAAQAAPARRPSVQPPDMH